MINIEELNAIVDKMSNYKPAKTIKVTTAFALYIKHSDAFKTVNKPSGSIELLFGLPVIIDDEIDGLYEFVYKEN